MVLHGPPRRIDPNGDYVAGQMYVQAFRLAQPRTTLPVLFWHGGGMTGSQWETTPDGRPGWLWKFLNAGYDVLVSDSAERGRSSWARYPEIYSDAPYFRTKNEAWEMFRMGPPGSYASDPKDRKPYVGHKFPVDHFDGFAKQWVPRWSGHEDMILKAYGQLIEKVGPCIVVGHSQGAGFAAAIAQKYPDIVQAVIAIEPGGMPIASEGPLPPHLIVWGDYMGEPTSIWKNYLQLVNTYIAVASRRSENRLEILDLPAAGHVGNSHFPMCDINSDDVAALLLAWLDQQSLQ